MKREDLEHIIRAACGNGYPEIVIIGSQAILGQFPDAPEELCQSQEADVFPRHDPLKSIEIDGAIGELSAFHNTFGYYAHGVDETTAVLPMGWETRLIKVQNENTGGGIGWCLEAHDLAVSKLVAGRDKDMSFIKTLLSEKMVNPKTLAARLAATQLPLEKRGIVQQRLTRLLNLGPNTLGR